MLEVEERQLRHFVIVDLFSQSGNSPRHLWMSSELDNTRTATSKKRVTGDNKQKRKRLSGIIKNAVRREASILIALMDLISMAL